MSHAPDRGLADLKVGEAARVAGYHDASDYSERLIQLGLIPGTLIRLEPG